MLFTLFAACRQRFLETDNLFVGCLMQSYRNRGAKSSVWKNQKVRGKRTA